MPIAPLFPIIRYKPSDKARGLYGFRIPSKMTSLNAPSRPCGAYRSMKRERMIREFSARPSTGSGRTENFIGKLFMAPYP